MEQNEAAEVGGCLVGTDVMALWAQMSCLILRVSLEGLLEDSKIDMVQQPHGHSGPWWSSMSAKGEVPN